MPWVCTNCSTANEDELTECFVCGEKRPADFKSKAKLKTESKGFSGGTDSSREFSDAETPKKGKIVFSNMDAFIDSVKSIFSRRSDKKRTEKPKETKRVPESDGSAEVKPVEKPKEATKAEISKPKKGGLFSSPFAKPWPEHKIKFDVPAIQAKGFVSSEQETMNGVKGYRFHKEGDASQFMRVEMVLIQKMAHKV